MPPATTSGSPIIIRALRRTTANAPSRISPIVSGRSGINAVLAASSTAGRRNGASGAIGGRLIVPRPYRAAGGSQPTSVG